MGEATTTLDDVRVKLLRQLDAAYLELRKVFEGTDQLEEFFGGVFGDSWSYLPVAQVKGMDAVAKQIVRLNQLIRDLESDSAK